MDERRESPLNGKKTWIILLCSVFSAAAFPSVSSVLYINKMLAVNVIIDENQDKKIDRNLSILDKRQPVLETVGINAKQIENNVRQIEKMEEAIGRVEHNVWAIIEHFSISPRGNSHIPLNNISLKPPPLATNYAKP